MDKNNKEEDVVLSPHLGYTHLGAQGGSANGRNVSLLMKSDINLTEAQKKLLCKMVGVEYIEKMSYEGLRKKLREAVKDKYEGYNDCVWLEDFDENILVFSNYDDLYSVEYVVDSDGDVILMSAATPVSRIISYEEASGNIILSESADGVDSKVVSLIEKSFDKLKDNKQLKNLLKTQIEKGKNNMSEEIQKAVDSATAELLKQLNKSKDDLAEALKDLEKAKEENKAFKEQVEAIIKADQEAKDAKRLEVIKTVIVDEEKAVEFQKSVAALEDEAFNVVIKSLEVKKEAMENSALFKQTSSGTDEESGGQDSNLAALLKAKYSK